MLLRRPLAKNHGFPTVLVMTTGLMLLASPLTFWFESRKYFRVQGIARMYSDTKSHEIET
jgi:hypothetical protein